MTTATHILIVDDQASVREALREGLWAEGFKISEAANKQELMAALAGEDEIDLITLDLMLGDEDGLELAREIRASRNVPIVMITALVDPVDRVKGLEHGADDYIVKPFHIREVLLRIQCVLRRYHVQPEEGAEETSNGQETEIYDCDVGTVDVRRREFISKAKQPVQLTDAELDILVVFLRNPARVISRNDLSMMLKGRPWSPEDRTLDGHIARLRKKIEPDVSDPRLVKTVWRVGYVYTGEVTRRS